MLCVHTIRSTQLEVVDFGDCLLCWAWGDASSFWWTDVVSIRDGFVRCLETGEGVVVDEDSVAVAEITPGRIDGTTTEVGVPRSRKSRPLLEIEIYFK